MTDFKFSCPHCQQSLEAPPDMVGETIKCPTCKNSLRIPVPQPTQSQTSQKKGAEPTVLHERQRTEKARKAEYALSVWSHSGKIPSGDSATSPEELSNLYQRRATENSRFTMFIWCLAGGVYAAMTWHLLWLPAILIFVPGIFIASLIAAVSFIPLWSIWKKMTDDYYVHRRRNWGLFVASLILKGANLASPVAGAVLYVRLLKRFLD